MVFVGAMETTTIGDVARFAGITVRTLHHYDDIHDVFGLVMAVGYTGQFLCGTDLLPIDQFSVETHQRRPLMDQDAGPFVENFVFTPTGR